MVLLASISSNSLVGANYNNNNKSNANHKSMSTVSNSIIDATVACTLGALICIASLSIYFCSKNYSKEEIDNFLKCFYFSGRNNSIKLMGPNLVTKKLNELNLLKNHNKLISLIENCILLPEILILYSDKGLYESIVNLRNLMFGLIEKRDNTKKIYYSNLDEKFNIILNKINKTEFEKLSLVKKFLNDNEKVYSNFFKDIMNSDVYDENVDKKTFKEYLDSYLEKNKANNAFLERIKFISFIHAYKYERKYDKYLDEKSKLNKFIKKVTEIDIGYLIDGGHKSLSSRVDFLAYGMFFEPEEIL